MRIYVAIQYYLLFILLPAGSTCSNIVTETQDETTVSQIPCNLTETQQVDYDFNSNVVQNEYIVAFKGYYKRSSRERYISSVLHGSGVKNWSIVERVNPAKDYPSDFDVVLLNVDDRLPGVEALRDHPLVKSVSAQRMVQRSIKYSSKEMEEESASEEDCEGSGCLYGGWRSHRTRNVQSLNTSNKKNAHYTARKLLRAVPRQITAVLQADVLWAMGVTGKGVKVGVFDTGLAKHHPHFRQVRERTDWTNERSLEDGLGHGTFVAGVIASQGECLGFAPDADLHIFRVFTNNQVSYTSWFLDAFNYAIMKKINVLNLSIGGPDFMDQPFVDKVWELSANKVIMVSAIGNDGPLYGTLNNPADQMDVIGVGGINFEERIAKFSSRGMTTWELPQGYGRLKPDIVTYGSSVRGSSIKGGCRSLSGTSVASPVVAGAVALLASGMSPHELTPAAMKQALTATARRLPRANMFEQGHGKLHLLDAYRYLREYTPRATLSPPYLDLTECEYMWPYCTQPLYHGALPIVANVTVVNGLGVSGQVTRVRWHPHLPHGPLLNVAAEHSPLLWPWSGWIALLLTVGPEGRNFDGTVEGHLNITIESVNTNPDENDERRTLNTTLVLPLRVKIIPTPARDRRLLWDQFHSLRYPGGYFPRDDLRARHDPLDWHADHVHTNFRDMYRSLRDHGYYIEVMGTPLTCIDLEQYGAMLLVDPEEEFFPEELAALRRAVAQGLSLVVFADWYNATLVRHVKFYDENTRQWWVPETGGANVPALNDLLSMYQVALGDRVFSGGFELGGHSMYYASGTHIHTFPERGVLVAASLSDQGHQIITGESHDGKKPESEKQSVPILGLLQTEGDAPAVTLVNQSDTRAPKAGRLAVYGDSNCLDSSHMEKPCFWLLHAVLEYCATARLPQVFRPHRAPHPDVNIIPSQLPQRLEGSRLHLYSRVLASDGSGPRPPPECPHAAPLTPHPLHAARSLAPLYARPALQSHHGDGDWEGAGATERALRAWRGRSQERDDAPSSTLPSAPAFLIFAAALYALYYSVTVYCRRGRRYPRRNVLMSLAT